MERRAVQAFWAALAIVAAAFALANGRELSQVQSGARRLRTLVFTDSLYSDHNTCHTTELPSERDRHVALGKPNSCGLGCQYALTASTNDTASTTINQLLGAPDAYPAAGPSDNAFKSVNTDTPPSGADFLTVTWTVQTAVYVSKIRIYETDHPGAIVKVEGLATAGAGASDTFLLWEAEKDEEGSYIVSIPGDSSQFDDATSTLKTASRIFEPPVRAPRNRTLQAFRITLDVAQVQGPNALDAVEVWGDDATGLPIEDYGDTCDHQTDFNCHYKCTAADLVTDARIGAAETVLTDVVDWLSASLTLSSADAGPYKPGELEEDEGEYVCDDVPLPQELARTGIFTHGLLIVPTLRPDMTPVRAYPCRPVQRAFSPSDAPARPTVIRVNMVPSFAEAALAEDAQARGLRLRRAAADAVLHEVYKALGWGWDRTSIDARDDILRTKHGESAVESRSSDTCRDFTDCSEEWDLRFIIMNRSPAIVREARAHFGDTSMEFVEMENNLGDGLQSQPPECVTGTDDTEQPSDFNFLPENCNPGMLLEHRLFLGELMTTAMYSRLAYYDRDVARWQFQTGTEIEPSIRSRVSLAMFEDLGYFVPDYSAAELLIYGRNLGSEFVSNACNEWPETAAHYTCAKVNETAFENSPNLGCSPNRVHKGRCLVTGWSTPAPRAAYRYFGNNQGGMSADLDYCPIIGPAGYVWTDDTGKPTADPGTTWTACNVIGDEPEVNSLFEETGPASRCLEAQPTGSTTVGCFKVFCEGTSNVYVKLEDEWKFCDYSATSEATVYFADAAISIVCPDPAQICPSFATLTGPHIKVYDMPAPADPNQLSSPSNLITIESASLKVNVETSVVRIGSGGVRMDVAVDGKVLRSYAEGWGVDPETGRIRLRYEYEIVGLPATPTTGKMLEFRLVDQYGRTLDTEVFHVHIKHTDIAQGVLSDVTGSTEYEPFDANSGVTRWPFVGVSEPDYPTIEPSAPGMAQPTTDTTDAPENGASWAPQHAGGRVLTAEETGSEEPSWLSNQFVFEEFLVVKLSNPVIPREIRLYENRSPGSLTRIEALTGPEGAVSTVMWERERPRRTEMTVQAATDPAITAQSFPLRVPSDATNLRTDTLRLTWGLKYTSWPEVAAVGVYGDAAELPRVVSLTEAAYGGLPTEAVLGVGEKTTVVVTFRLETASTLFWETPEFLVATRRHCSPATGVCTETVEELTWGRVLTQEGVVFGPADINVAVEIDTGAMGRTELREWMSGGVSGSVVLYNALFARNAQPTGTPAYGEVVATRRHTDGITLRGPPCRHGVPIRDGPLDSGWCKCFAGAYGPTCEFLECPNNCSDDGVYAAGVCDRWTGTCKCALGRIGSDCSGTLGQCVLSYDGSCPPGTAKGSYLFNTEDDNNMNRAFGTVPESMICDGTAPGSINAFGCPERVSIDMCCQPTELPSCPFAENAPPCSSPACPIAGGTLSIDTLTEDLVADPSGGWRAPACLEVVNAYCFWHPEDAACHTFARPYVAEDPCFATPQDPTCASYTRPPTPVEFACPRHLAIRHCAADLDRPGCREFIALRSCGFPSGVCAACRDAQGVPDYRSEGCRNAIISHCTASRSDPECDLHGFGNDGCLFQAGSAPCNSLACRPEFYQRGECLAVVDGHCRSTPTDPQCLALGYGDTTSAVASYARPANESTCPWGLIQQECLLAPADPYCVTLAQIGLVQPAGPIPVGTASAPVPRAFAPPQEPESAAEAAEEVAARTALKRSTLDVEMERQQEATRQALFREIFEWADGNGDNRLVASEVAVARNMIRSFRMSGVPMPLSRGVLSALEESGVLDSLTPWYLGVDGATDGNHLTRDQFLLQMEVLFQDWTARNGSAYE